MNKHLALASTFALVTIFAGCAAPNDDPSESEGTEETGTVSSALLSSAMPGLNLWSGGGFTGDLATYDTTVPSIDTLLNQDSIYNKDSVTWSVFADANFGGRCQTFMPYQGAGARDMLDVVTIRSIERDGKSCKPTDAKMIINNKSGTILRARMTVNGVRGDWKTILGGAAGTLDFRADARTVSYEIESLALYQWFSTCTNSVTVTKAKTPNQYQEVRYNGKAALPYCVE